MTKNERFYVDEIVKYLNLLNGNVIFIVEFEDWKDDSILTGIKISTTSTAYRHELAMLTHLIFDMTQCCHDLPTTIELH